MDADIGTDERSGQDVEYNWRIGKDSGEVYDRNPKEKREKDSYEADDEIKYNGL
jgi:hypothetical protein